MDRVIIGLIPYHTCACMCAYAMMWKGERSCVRVKSWE